MIFPFGEGDGTILVHNVTCLGNESRLVDCPLQLHDDGICQHSQDAGVICQAEGSELGSITTSLSLHSINVYIFSSN